MALRPLHVHQHNKDGTIKRDKHGDPIPHKKLNQAKTRREMTDAEREHFDQQIKDSEEQTRIRAKNILKPIQEAHQVLEN